MSELTGRPRQIIGGIRYRSSGESHSDRQEQISDNWFHESFLPDCGRIRLPRRSQSAFRLVGNRFVYVTLERDRQLREISEEQRLQTCVFDVGPEQVLN